MHALKLCPCDSSLPRTASPAMPSGSISDPYPLLARSQIRASPTRRSAWSRTRRPSARSRPATRTTTRRCWHSHTLRAISRFCPSASATTAPAWLTTASVTIFGQACRAWTTHAAPAVPSPGRWSSADASLHRCRLRPGARAGAQTHLPRNTRPIELFVWQGSPQ